MRLKNRTDIRRFPDKGTLTIIRENLPPLNFDQLSVLKSLTYYHFGPALKTWRNVPCARGLRERGLVEQDPAHPEHFRLSIAGRDVLRAWEEAGLLP